MNTFKKAILWLDNNLLFLITGFLLAFIPLYPKFPLFELIPGYIVRVRIEDILISMTIVIWIIQILRGKAKFGPNPLVKPIFAYLIVGILSMLSAIFVIQTVPMETIHISKMVLHFFRRVEYFSLFFIFYSAVKSVKQVKIYLVIFLLTVTAVTIYGYGQKYLYWPAFSTMNREFAKGWHLYLTQHARVLSTFGGHYDLAAFTMASLVILWSLFFMLKKKLLRLIVFVILAGAFWLLILTASRTSFIAYIAGVTVLFFFFMFRFGVKWALLRWFTVVVLSVAFMLTFGDLSDRFLKLLKLDARISGIKSLFLQPIGTPPNAQQIALLENNLDAVTSKSDFPPLRERPTDVIEDIPEGFIATQSASGTAIFTQTQRTYSKTAIVYDLSTGIRLDALWPRAIAGFKRNPLLGSGYSTLTKTQVSEFTEAESTDNDFLRSLGETGILGFLTFGWILAMAIVIIWKVFTQIKDAIIFALTIALGSIIFGLLVNAVYIDIFEASKVAFTFWALVGIVLGAVKLLPLEKEGTLLIPRIPDSRETINSFKRYLLFVIKSDKTYLLLIIILAFSLRYYKIHTPLADWHSWRQADTSSVTRNYVRYGINVLFPRYDDLSSVASGKPNPQGYRFVEFPFYNFISVIADKLFPGFTLEYSSRLTSILMSLGTLIFIYYLTKKYLGFKIALWSSLFFAILPYNIYWSRTILPEPTLVFLTSGMIYFFDSWIEKEKFRLYFLSIIFGILALLTKFTTLFFLIPMFYLVWVKWRSKIFYKPFLYLYVLLIIIPFFVWRWHISHYPEGIPAYLWLLNGNGIRFKGAFFWWIFADRIAKLILGGWGIILFVFGLIKQVKKDAKSNYIFHFWLLGLLVYLIVFATGNVQHDYYQIILVPILSIFMGIGVQILLETPNDIFHPLLTRVLLIVTIIFMLMFGWYQSRDLYNINHPEIVEAGAEMQRILGDRRGTVIAPYGGDTAFLYQTGRRGWPLMEGDIDEMIRKGAHYYISVNHDELTNELTKIAKLQKDPLHSFKLIKETPQFVIIQLVPDNLLPET